MFGYNFFCWSYEKRIKKFLDFRKSEPKTSSFTSIASSPMPGPMSVGSSTAIDIKSFTMFDIEYMFTTLRSKSVGEGIEVQLPCLNDECEANQKIKVDLDSVYVANLDTAADMHLKINDEISVDLKYLGYSDSLTQAQRATETEAAINMVAKTIETIYSGEETYATKDAPFKEVVRFVESLNNDQFAKVINFMTDSPVLTYDLDYKCSACGHQNVRQLKGLTDFFS